MRCNRRRRPREHVFSTPTSPSCPADSILAELTGTAENGFRVAVLPQEELLSHRSISHGQPDKAFFHPEENANPPRRPWPIIPHTFLGSPLSLLRVMERADQRCRG